MKHYSYFLFPTFFIVLGVISIGVSVYILFSSIDFANLSQEYQSLGGAITFLLLGGMLTTFRGRIIVETGRRLITKEYRVFGILLSKDLVKIPEKVNHILVQQRQKQGGGFIQRIIGFSYKLNSSDMFLTTESGAVRIIITDHERAVKIAQVLKDQLNLELIIRKNHDS